MFKFLKDKLKSAISKFSEGVEKEGKAEEKPIEEPVGEEKGFFAKIKERIVGKEEEKKVEVKKESIEEKRVEGKVEIRKEKEPEEKVPKQVEKRHEVKEHQPKHKIGVKEEKTQPVAEAEPETEEGTEKKSIFARFTEKIITTKINEEQFEKLFWELELALMENNVAIEVIEKIKDDLKQELVEKPIRRTKVEKTIADTLKNSIEELFEKSDFDLIHEIKNKEEKPYIIAFFGINGSGKTTSIAKLASMLKEKGISCVLAAADTFRAASIEQLQHHADKLGIRIIKHNYGADPAAVAFDAIKHAKSKNIDVVLIDTAGRMHSNVNLLDEMKKIIRVSKPDLKIFVGESITGNDCVDQARVFNDAVGIDGIILAKADIDEKGGAAVSVSYVTKKPILYLGVGQKYGDLQEFDSALVLKGLGLA